MKVNTRFKSYALDCESELCESAGYHQREPSKPSRLTMNDFGYQWTDKYAVKKVPSRGLMWSLFLIGHLF